MSTKVDCKGRLAFRQYMPDKPTKYGIKDFVLAESDTGYCLKFMTYTGKYLFPCKDNRHPTYKPGSTGFIARL